MKFNEDSRVKPPTILHLTPSISSNDILELNIALPKEGKGIESINSKFDVIYSKISLNHAENKKLSDLRDWLLPMLMNGQVTVKDL